METFSASAQYDDLKGSAAFDESDITDATQWLRDKKHITNDNEIVVGISIYIGETSGKNPASVFCTFLTTTLTNDDDIPDMLKNSVEPIKVRRIVLDDMSITDFFALFKRSNITLSPKGLIEGKTYTED